MNVFFDCDFTLTGIHGGLRPYVREVFEQLIADGHTVYIWSGVRVPWDIYENFGLEEFITGVYLKPIADDQAGHYAAIERHRIPVWPDYVVDDNVGPVEAFGGYVVPPYIYVQEPDDHLLRMYRDFRAWVAEKGEAPPG